MDLDRLLAIFGVLVGVIGLWLAYYFYKKTVRAKVLAIAYTSPVPLVLPGSAVLAVVGAGAAQRQPGREFQGLLRMSL